jgi:hypothetical protein
VHALRYVSIILTLAWKGIRLAAWETGGMHDILPTHQYFCPTLLGQYLSVFSLDLPILLVVLFSKNRGGRDPKEKVTKKNYLHTKKNDLLKSQYISFTVIHKIPMKPKTNTTTTITKKQKILLTIVFTFRFINSKQIQQLLNHKDHRRINSWLKDLTEKGYS